MRNVFLIFLAALALAGCDYKEVTREVGYKGKARIDPWLAAERFAEYYADDVRALVVWSSPTTDDAVWFVPASILGNESYIRQVERWVKRGGHLVLLVEYSDPARNDWTLSESSTEPPKPMLDLVERAGITVNLSSDGGRVTSKVIRFGGERYEVDADSRAAVSVGDEKPGVMASLPYARGRLTVLTDSRIFRNRWLDEADHAALLVALIEAADDSGAVVFLRGSGLSLMTMLGDHLWPLLLGLAVLTLLWLWKNLTRFGPLEAESGTSELRGFDHHLEALGDFQWRLDHANGLLAPLRAKVVDRGQHLSQRTGRRDDDFFQFLGECAGLPRERVFRALAEQAPPDSSVLTRTTADLQRLLQALQ